MASSAKKPPGKKPAKRPHTKSLSLHPLTFEEAIRILVPPVRAPEVATPESSPTEPKSTPASKPRRKRPSKGKSRRKR